MIAPAGATEPQPFRLALRLDEAADALAISPRTLKAMVAARKVPFFHVGARGLRFNLAALQKWLDDQTIGVAGREQADNSAGFQDAAVSSAIGSANGGQSR